MGRRVLRIVLLFVSAAATVAIFAVAPNAIHNRLMFGTFDTAGIPPRVDYCGRRYYPAERSTTETLAHVHGLTQVDTAPSGMPVVAKVMSPALKARYHTNVCTMAVWVQTGPDSYRAYALSGGP